MLLELGNASKMQADQSSFFNAERWKQEGQLEKLKSYLKLKEEEMNLAKLNGNVRLYRELNLLVKQLDNEVLRNSEILPVLANLIIDHDNINTEKHPCYVHSNTRLSVRKYTVSKNDMYFRSNQKNSNVIFAEYKPSQSPSFSLNDSINILNLTNINAQLVKPKTSLEKNSHLQSLLKHTINNLKKIRDNTESPQVIKILIPLYVTLCHLHCISNRILYLYILI